MLHSKVIRSELLDELERTKRMIKVYNKEIQNYSKGSYVKRNISGKEYVYWCFRDGKKVLSKYLGKSEDVDFLMLDENIKRYKYYKKLLRDLEKEKMDLERILK